MSGKKNLQKSKAIKIGGDKESKATTFQLQFSGTVEAGQSASDVLEVLMARFRGLVKQEFSQVQIDHPMEVRLDD